MSAEDKLSVKSSAHTVEDAKAKAQEKEVQEMKKKAEEDKAKALKKRKEHQKDAKETAEKQKKAAEKEKKAKETKIKNVLKKNKKLEKAVVTAGSAFAMGAIEDISTKKGKKKLILIAGILVVCVLGFLLFGNQIKHLLGIEDGGSVLLSSLSQLLPDSEMGYNHIDFNNAILGEAREKQELIVLEQDVEVESEISNALANISLFKKTKKIHSYGTGVYTVNMESINDEHITVEDEKRTVTIEIPHTVLQYVNLDVDKTEFEETDKAIFGFGDIKMTQEQQKILSQSIDEAMREKLDTKAMYKKADEVALLKVREIFQPLVSEVSDEFVVEIVQKK